MGVSRAFPISSGLAPDFIKLDRELVRGVDLTAARLTGLLT
jgi:hypothetical protein